MQTEPEWYQLSLTASAVPTLSEQDATVGANQGTAAKDVITPPRSGHTALDGVGVCVEVGLDDRTEVALAVAEAVTVTVEEPVPLPDGEATDDVVGDMLPLAVGVCVSVALPEPLTVPPADAVVVTVPLVDAVTVAVDV